MFRSSVSPQISMGLLDVSHADAWLALVNENRAYLREWFMWVDPFLTRDDSIRFLQGAMAQYASGTGLKIGIWHEELLVGSLSIQEFQWAHQTATLGYWVSQKYQGQGIVSQCVEALMQQLHQHYSFVRFEARCAEGNRKSRAVLERLGFKAEARLSDSMWLYDHFESEMLYAKLL